MFVRMNRLAIGSLSVVFLLVGQVLAQDWPQWRGVNRDAKAAGFIAPATWPAEMAQQWQVTVGEGVATPALVGDRVYVFARQDGKEMLRCLNVADGQEMWQQSYETPGVNPPAASFSGPRCSPTVADGKVVTLGVQGILSCFDATDGRLLWRNEDYRGNVPRFATASSPLIAKGSCIAQLGGGDGGAIIALDLQTGAEQWTWTGDAPAYASPVLMSVEGTDVILTPTDKNMVALALNDGKLLWQVPFTQGRYNAATPLVDGQTVIYASRGTTAERVQLAGDAIETQEQWNNADAAVMFNSPVIKDNLIFGLTGMNVLFCVRKDTGETAWTAPLSAEPAAPPTAEGGRGRRGRGGGGRGYGSLVDAGAVLFGLTPAGELFVFEPSDQEFRRLASYKVAAGNTYAYPVIAGQRVLIKDEQALTLWTIQ